MIAHIERDSVYRKSAYAHLRSAFFFYLLTKKFFCDILPFVVTEVTFMSVCKSLDLSGEWFISHDPENIGKDSGWEKEIQPGAAEAYVPSIIQQFFPDYHGVAYYWCRFTP